MTSVPACPYCNAELPSLPTAPVLAQTPCPCCGEPVGSDRFPMGLGDLDTHPTPPSIDVAQRKRRTLRTILAIMCGMAALALAFALWTRDIRRQRDPKPEPVEEVAQRPADLVALGYLPHGTNIAIGVHIAALEKDKVGRELLRDPRPAPLSLVASVLDLAGLTLADVDHIVAGSELKSLNFHVTTVVVTRTPYDRDRVKAAAERHKVHVTTYRNGPLYRFADLPQVPKLWCAAPRVLVHTTLPTGELERIVPGTKEPAAALTAPARQALTGRLSKQSRAWIVGDLRPAHELIDTLKIFAGPFKEQLRLLTLVHAFAGGIATTDAGTLSLTGDFYTGVPAATKEIGKYLERVQLPGATAQKIVTPPDVEAPEAQWVTWQVRLTADALRSALETLPLGGGR